ncbi:methyltransferase domain-containing protein [Nevskia sp.]|uniref:class I SAM-dependent methyltransferase n=1 Tax=Nevskia sp. TaxID=1929292 RepID=UPI0025D07892|nr:methyltransferase domain-containing protein [Nevskia sp.]
MPNRLAASGGQPFNRQALKLWLASPRGKRLLAIEESELARVLPSLFGRHCLQIGNWGGQRLLASADMLHRAVIGSFVDSPGDTQAVVQPESLPILESSVDAVLLPHTLEFSPSPHNLLREVDRVLTDRGRLMILGFNPWSLWGLRRLLGLGPSAFPPGARFHGTGRIGDWLELLDFEVTELRRFGVGFPWAAPSTAGEPFHLGSLVKPWMEGYLLVARKRVIPMSLVGRVQRASVRPLVGRALGAAANTEVATPELNSPAE